MFALLVLAWLVAASGVAALTIDRFSTLEGWEEVQFPKIPTPSTYTVDRAAGALRMQSSDGASMLVLTRSFATYETPVIEWEWTVTQQVSGADYGARDGDDAAARLYVAFRRPIEERGPFQRAWARTQRRLYGQVPPVSAINYLWAETGTLGTVVLSVYTDASALIIVDSGVADLGSWRRHRRNVIDDYRTAFGEDPPAEYFLAVMTDSDNTRSETDAFLRYLAVSPR